MVCVHVDRSVVGSYCRCETEQQHIFRVKLSMSGVLDMFLLESVASTELAAATTLNFVTPHVVLQSVDRLCTYFCCCFVVVVVVAAAAAVVFSCCCCCCCCFFVAVVFLSSSLQLSLLLFSTHVTGRGRPHFSPAVDLAQKLFGRENESC